MNWLMVSEGGDVTNDRSRLIVDQVDKLREWVE